VRSAYKDAPKRELDLALYAVTAVEPDEFDRKHCFKLVPRTAADRTYVFQAASEEDALAWIQVRVGLRVCRGLTTHTRCAGAACGMYHGRGRNHVRGGRSGRVGGVNTRSAWA
jgi:hypothetical protein